MEKIKTKLSGRFRIALSLILAIIITFGVGAIITQYNISQDNGYKTILKAPTLLHSVQIAKIDGVITAIHGWALGDYRNLTHTEAAKNGGNSDPYLLHVSVNRVMQVYLLLFLVFGTFPLVFFVIWKLITSRFKREFDKQLLETEIKYPNLLTIIVPAYNEQTSIRRCIESLLNQDYKGSKEIIVVNDGSTDRTAAMAAQYPITLLDLKQNVGKASALNEGIKIAKGDIILFTDGDSNMCVDAVSSMVRCFSAHPDADIVTGQVLINKPEKFSFINCCQMIEYHIEQEIVRYLQSLTDEIVVCPGPITAVKRHVCDKVPYTNDTILEDADFSASLRENKFIIKLDPYAKIYTNAPETIKQWYKQRTRWWYGNLQVWRVHKKWAIKNPWMVYSYLSFVTSLCSLVMVLVMPYFMTQYGNTYSFVIKGLICFSILMLMNSVMISIFFRHNKMLMLLVVPYMIIYPILKVFVLSYFYVLYITGIGLNIKHGTRHIKAK